MLQLRSDPQWAADALSRYEFVEQSIERDIAEHGLDPDCFDDDGGWNVPAAAGRKSNSDCGDPFVGNSYSGFVDHGNSFAGRYVELFRVDVA
jgi:hypothetical protein